MTAQQIIDVGVKENDGSGDSIQTAGSKINHNFLMRLNKIEIKGFKSFGDKTIINFIL